jgi:hypothetical protein
MPLLDLIWVMLMWFLLFAWIVVITGVVTDVFRSPDLSGMAKAGWVLFVIVIPWLGVIVYLIARGDGLSVRYREALGDRKRKRTLDPRSGTAMGVDWRSSASTRRVPMSGALDYDSASTRVMR